MWVWNQAAGTMSRNGTVVSHGYAGNGRGLNNPAMQNVPGVGPLPRGRYTMTKVGDSPNTGKFTITLDPCEGTDTCGRSEFRIHGDNPRLDHSASHGCIILPNTVRRTIWGSGDHDLEVDA